MFEHFLKRMSKPAGAKMGIKGNKKGFYRNANYKRSSKNI